MPIVADQIMKVKFLNNDQIDTIGKLENELLCSIVNLFVTKILSMNIKISDAPIILNEIINRDISPSNKTLHSDNYDFILKFISNFISNVSMTLDFNYSVTSKIQLQLPEIIQFHCESLNQILEEQNKILQEELDIVKIPLLQFEIIMQKMPCYILPECINNTYYCEYNSSSLLPSIGIIYLTRYRIIYYGYPINPYANNISISFSIPFGNIKKIKINDNDFIPACFNEFINITTKIQLKYGKSYFIGFKEAILFEIFETFFKNITKQNAFILEEIFTEQTDKTFEDKNELSVTKSNINFGSLVNIQQNDIKLLSNEHDTNVKNKSLFRKTKPSINALNAFATINTKKMILQKLKSSKKSSNNDNVFNNTQIKSKNIRDVIQSIYTNIFCDQNINETIITKKFSKLSLYVKDYQRLGLLIFNIFLPQFNELNHCWRLSLINTKLFFPSLPQIFALPSLISDDFLFKLSKYFKNKRFPILSWRCTKFQTNEYKKNTISSALFRSSSLVKNMPNILVTKGPNQTNNNSSLKKKNVDNLNEAENYIYNLLSVATKFKNLQKNNDQIIQYDELYNQIYEQLDKPHLLYLTNNYDISDIEYIYSQIYVFGDKTYPKGKTLNSDITFINIDLPDFNQVEISFDKLFKSYSVNKPSEISISDHLYHVSKSKWLVYLSQLIELSSTIAFLMYNNPTYCIIGFGDGTEISAQINSLTQIIIDPFYRTIEGFQILVEKEWIAYNYKFAIKNGTFGQNNTTFIPIFMQFLDCVHQIMLQYPNAFEFNNYFLKFLAYHHISNRFSTFLLSSIQSCQDENNIEINQKESEMSFDMFSAKTSFDTSEFVEEKEYTSFTEDIETNNIPNYTNESIWDYINRYHDKIPIFYNTQYIYGMNSILLASSHIANIQVWDFYYEYPNFTDGGTSFYDLELINNDIFTNPNSIINYDIIDDFAFTESQKSSHCLNISEKIEKSQIEFKNEFRYYDNSSCFGYQLTDLPLVVDKYNFEINNKILKNVQDDFKLSTFLNTNIVTHTKKQLFQPHNISYINDQIIYEIKDSDFFQILNAKKSLLFFTNKDKKDSTFMDSKYLNNYFDIVQHEFIEAVLNEDLVCKVCNKNLTGKINYTYCHQCDMKCHVKCSKLTTQICNFGIETQNFISDTNFTTIKRSFLKNSKFKKKSSILISNSTNNESFQTRDSQNTRDSIDYSSLTNETQNIGYSDNLLEGFLSTKNKFMKINSKKYYVLDKNSNFLSIYDDSPKININTTLNEKILLTDLYSCNMVFIANTNSTQKHVTNMIARTKSTYKNVATQSLSIDSQKPNFIELKFNNRKKPLLLKGSNDDETQIWFYSFQQFLKV